MSVSSTSPKRIKFGPRTMYGYLDTALEDLLRTAEANGRESDVVRRKRRAILQRVRRIVRADRREREDSPCDR